MTFVAIKSIFWAVSASKMLLWFSDHGPQLHLGRSKSPVATNVHPKSFVVVEHHCGRLQCFPRPRCSIWWGGRSLTLPKNPFPTLSAIRPHVCPQDKVLAMRMASVSNQNCCKTSRKTLTYRLNGLDREMSMPTEATESHETLNVTFNFIHHSHDAGIGSLRTKHLALAFKDKLASLNILSLNPSLRQCNAFTIHSSLYPAPSLCYQ